MSIAITPNFAALGGSEGFGGNEGETVVNGGPPIPSEATHTHNTANGHPLPECPGGPARGLKPERLGSGRGLTLQCFGCVEGD